MWLLISLLIAGCIVAIYFRFFTKGTAILLNRGAMLQEESMSVNCTNCHTPVKRQRNGQQCPKCRVLF